MKNFIVLLSGFVLSLTIGCTEETINQIVENDFPDQLTPYESFFDLATAVQRRSTLMNELPSNSIAVLTTKDIYLRNGDVDYDFHPSSIFYYLTGFEEPNSAAIITKSSAGVIEFIMFVEAERQGGMLIWLGPVIGPDGAEEYYGADQGYTIFEFAAVLQAYLESGLYQNVYSNIDENESIAEDLENAGISTSTFFPIDETVNYMRMIKSSNEINAIRRAVNVSVQAFQQTLLMIEPGMYEYEVAAILEMVQGINGCRFTAFPTIVASGPNINTIHYPAGQRQMQSGDLVMIDHGAEYDYYAADITRTLPVNGTFTRQQKDVYEIVLATHKAVIESIAPGVNYDDLYWMNVEMMIDGLITKGIISGDRTQIISSYQYRQYIPAALGHSIGLDVHDPFLRDQAGNKILRENMVMAFEPHIYLYSGDTTVDPAYWNISARIEDDVLVTSNGYEILSVQLPYEISELEALMNQ